MGQQTTSRQATTAAMRDIAPIMVGMVPFGLVTGIATVEAGLAPWGAPVFSAFIFAGAAQLAALDLIGRDAGVLVAVGTIAIINARFLMYSANIAPRFGEESLGRRAVVAYFLTDQAFAVTITKLDAEPGYGPRWAYFVSASLTLWTGWIVFTLVGALAGAMIPPDIPLSFAVPLVFAALLVPAVVDRPTLAAALSSAVVAVAAGGLPANLGLLAAAGTGIVVGWTTSVMTGTADSVPEGADR